MLRERYPVKRSHRRAIWAMVMLVAAAMTIFGMSRRFDATMDHGREGEDHRGEETLRLANLLTLMRWVDENPPLHGVAVRVIGDDHLLSEKEIAALWAMAESDDYELARVAVHCLARRYYDVDYLKLMRSFWRLCHIASGRDYFEDAILPDVYKEVGYNTEDALIAFVEAAMKGDVSSIGAEGAAWMKERFGDSDEGPNLDRILEEDTEGDLPAYDMPQSYGSARTSAVDQAVRHLYSEGLEDLKQAQRYIDSFDIFEVLTHLSYLTETKVPPSGVYRRHEPKHLNMHLVLYRALHGSTLLPDFYHGNEWDMFVAGESDYKAIWERLFTEDPLLKEANYSAAGLLFEVNNRSWTED